MKVDKSRKSTVSMVVVLGDADGLSSLGLN